tara:strand:- start:923 stop:1276 length:354 start_codon:yes stop_codon:yes gene_type:complete
MSSSTQKSSSERKNTKGPDLPWWVELLFVQIGLPDKWLSAILKSKKNSISLIIDNKKQIFYIILISIAFTSIQPVTKYYSRQNRCINWSINKTIDEELSVDKELLNAIAINYCNGGI